MAEARSATAIFCDDIRQEVGGKLSLIGCYGDELLVEHLPITLPKLAILVRLSSAPADPVERLSIAARFDGAILAELVVPAADLQSVAAARAGHHVIADAMLLVSPFSIGAAGVLQVDVETERGVIVAGLLNIREQRSNEAA